MSTMSPEMEALKTRLKATWMVGDYGYFSQYLEPAALSFLSSLAIAPGTEMLDVACGAGQTAIPAARQGARVTGIDISTKQIQQAKARAAAEGLSIRFEEGDAEDLPYDDNRFDLVLSVIGAMFAPRPERVAAEFIRVCRPGGRIIMANWTPEGHVGEMFKIIGKYVPPPPLMPSPLKWGVEATVMERFSSGIADLKTTRQFYTIKYPFPPADVVEFFREFYGPTNKAFASLDEETQGKLRHDLEELWSRNNLADDGSTHVEAEYLKVVVIKA